MQTAAIRPSVAESNAAGTVAANLSGKRFGDSQWGGEFAERGAVVPFTTPHLSGARVRRSRRGELELVMPNLSGGPGVYVIPWADMATFCQPTLHDQRLHALICDLPAVTPAAIRRFSRRVAAEGLAGRGVSGAAARAAQDDEQARVLTNFDLLLELVRQVEDPGENPVSPDEELPAVLERRARLAVARIAPRLARSADAVAASLEELAGAFSCVGVGRHLQAARLPQALARLEALRHALVEHVQCYPSENPDEVGRITAAIDRTTEQTHAALRQAHGMVRDLPGLLRHWSTVPGTVCDLLARPDWLLDGWDRVGGLWHGADGHRGRAATLVEMAGLLPPQSRDATGLEPETEMARSRPRVTLMQDWRTGVTVHQLIARNEGLLILAA